MSRTNGRKLAARVGLVVLGLVVLGLVVLSLALLGGWAWSKRARELPPLETLLPEFEQPDPQLERAPSSMALGVEVGVVSLEALLRELETRALACDDTGIRASVERLREYKRRQLAEAADPDAVSGASILYRRSKKERNPQIRLACSVDSLAQVEPSAGAGRPRVPGRALFVFDSPAYPLRHASLRRTYQTGEAAALDLRETASRFEAIYGEPSSRRGTIPLPGDAPAKLEPIRLEWRYADLLVQVSATSFGKLTSVDERVEVPWPIRSDAPQLSANELASAAKLAGEPPPG